MFCLGTHLGLSPPEQVESSTSGFTPSGGGTSVSMVSIQEIFVT